MGRRNNKPSPLVYTEPWGTMPSVCLSYWDGTELTYWVGLPNPWRPTPTGLTYQDPVHFGPVALNGRKINPGDLFVKVDWYGRSVQRIQVMIGTDLREGDYFTLTELHWELPGLQRDGGYAVAPLPHEPDAFTSDQVIVDLPDLN